MEDRGELTPTLAKLTASTLKPLPPLTYPKNLKPTFIFYKSPMPFLSLKTLKKLLKPLYSHSKPSFPFIPLNPHIA